MHRATRRGITGRILAWAGADLSWVIAAAVIAAAVALYFTTFVDLWPRWMDTGNTTYTHGVVIAAIGVWLVVRAREDLHGVQPVAQYWALLPALVLSWVWLVGERGGIITAYTAIWPLLAWTLVLAAAGRRTATRMVVPIGYLYFAIPIWGHGNWILRDLTVWAVGMLNRLAGVPAQVYESTVVIPQGRFEIADGCSGLHFFVVAAALAVLAGELHRDRLRTRALLVGIAVALALVSNWLRVWLIILAGYLTDMQSYLVRVDHYKFGWVVFAVAMMGFFLVLRKLPAPAAAQGRSTTSKAPTIPGAHSGPLTAWLIALVAAAALPLLTSATHALAGAPGTSAYEPKAIAGFSGPVSQTPVWEPRYRGASSEWRVAYIAGSGRVLDYYSNVYLRQRQGRELINDGNSLAGTGATWLQSGGAGFVETASGPVPVVEAQFLLGGGRQRWLSLYVYDIGGKRVASGRMTQLLTGIRSVWRDAPAGLHAAAAPCLDDCSAERSELAALLSAMMRE